MLALSTILSLLIGAAGWYYVFYSQAAAKLAGVEEQRMNVLRARLRRAGGVLMLLLAVAFFALFNTVDAEQHPVASLIVLLCVLALLAALVVLALLDVRLTWKLRQRRKGFPVDKH